MSGRTKLGRMIARIVAALSAIGRRIVGVGRRRVTEQTGPALRAHRGHRRYGYLSVNGLGQVKVPQEWRVIHEIVRLRERGLSYKSVADYLNGARERTRAGGSWNPTSVQAIYERTKADATKPSVGERIVEWRCQDVRFDEIADRLNKAGDSKRVWTADLVRSAWERIDLKGLVPSKRSQKYI